MITHEKAVLIRNAIRTLFTQDDPKDLPPSPRGTRVALELIDNCLVGTYHYLGRARYWHDNFDSYLREAPVKERVLVHKALLKECLDPAGDSYEHLMAIACAVAVYRAKVTRRNKKKESTFREEENNA